MNGCCDDCSHMVDYSEAGKGGKVIFKNTPFCFNEDSPYFFRPTQLQNTCSHFEQTDYEELARVYDEL